MSGHLSHLSLIFAVPALMCIPPASASAQTLVVRSGGPSAAIYPPGKRIAEGAQLTLKRGDKVTILSNSGTREFHGPGAFRIDAATVTAGNLGNAVGNSGTKQTRTGAVRGGMRDQDIGRGAFDGGQRLRSGTAFVQHFVTGTGQKVDEPFGQDRVIVGDYDFGHKGQFAGK